MSNLILTRNTRLFHNSQFFNLSCSDIKLFIECPRCFFKKIKWQIYRPGLHRDNFAIYNTIDQNLKHEFDIYRELQKPHPLIVEHGIDAIPLKHSSFCQWRGDNKHGKKGLIVPYSSQSIQLQGIVDDIWVTPEGQFIIVDYKTISCTSSYLLSNQNRWRAQLTFQLSFYAWLFLQAGFPVDETGYFLTCRPTGNTSLQSSLEFERDLLPYQVDQTVIERILENIVWFLNQESLPDAMPNCQYCIYTTKNNESLKMRSLQHD